MSDMELENISDNDNEQIDEHSQTEDTELNEETRNLTQTSETYSQEMIFTQCVPTTITKIFNETRDETNFTPLVAPKKLKIQTSENHSEEMTFAQCVPTNITKVFKEIRDTTNSRSVAEQSKIIVQSNQITKDVCTQPKIPKNLSNKKDASTQTIEEWPPKNRIVLKKVSENNENVFLNIEMGDSATNDLINKRKKTIRLGLSKKWKCPEKLDE